MDLLDALHYMFEEDLTPSSAEQQEAKEKLRAQLYGQIYERGEYAWVANRSGSDVPSSADGGPDFTPVDPDRELETKPYIPPTEFDPAASKPFGDLLDEPLG
jgi:hypothetical protein